MSASLALVTVLYNSADVLEGFFASLAKQSFQDFDLYIIDNSPDDLSYRATEECMSRYKVGQKIHLIKNAKNVGVAAGNNQGIEAALKTDAQYIGLVNNDIEFHQTDLLDGMLKKCKTAHLVIPKMLYFDSKKIWCAGGGFKPLQGINSHYGDQAEANDPKFNQAKKVAYAPTCFMLITREAFEKTGIMDEKYFVYFDDCDWVWRAGKLGYQVHYMPEYTIEHKVSSSTGGDESTFSIYYMNRNRIYFVRKNLGWFIPVAMSYTLITRAIRYFLYTGERRKAIAKAVVEGFKM